MIVLHTFQWIIPGSQEILVLNNSTIGETPLEAGKKSTIKTVS